MYDVRFRTGKDMRFSLKIAHRIVRAALLGIWLAFSTTSSEFARQSFTNFSTIYALSRAVLAIDELLIVIETARDCDIFQRPGQHRRRAYRTFWKRTTPHWLCITANIVALILWVTSRFEAGDEGLSGAQLGMWMAGIGFELVVRVFIEATDMLPPLMNTSIAERVSLLLLIIFGEAFQGIGTALNNISPGGRDWERGGIPSGGWGTHTIIQAVATLVIILLLFHSYYKGTAVGGEVRSAEIENTSIVVFIWGTLHLILHLASAVIVVGMRKITLFINTIEAADRFLSSPQEYVPQTPDWSSFTSDKVVGLFADSIPSVSNITDYYERSLVSMLSVIIGSNGAQIPQVDTADGIVNATLLLSSNNVTIPSSISSQLGQFPVIQQQAIITDSLDVYAGKQIFQVRIPFSSGRLRSGSFLPFVKPAQYKYVYLSAAIYLFSDVVLKAIQGLSLIRERDLGLIGKSVFSDETVCCRGIAAETLSFSPANSASLSGSSLQLSSPSSRSSTSKVTVLQREFMEHALQVRE